MHTGQLKAGEVRVCFFVVGKVGFFTFVVFFTNFGEVFDEGICDGGRLVAGNGELVVDFFVGTGDFGVEGNLELGAEDGVLDNFGLVGEGERL